MVNIAMQISIESTSGNTMFEVNRLLGGCDLWSHLSVDGEKFLLVNTTESTVTIVAALTLTVIVQREGALRKRDANIN